MSARRAACAGLIGFVLWLAFLTLALCLVLSGPARAHDWYPRECCSAADCAPVQGVRRADARGPWVLPSGERVDYEAARPTPAGVAGIHWCRYGGTGALITIGGRPCLFVPKAGG